MKNILYLFISLLTFTVASAQTITMNPRIISRGAPNAADPDGNYNIESQTKVTNNSADVADSMFTWTIIELNQPATWQLDMCDPFQCRTSIQQGQSFEFKINKGASDFFKVDYFFKNAQGNGTGKVAIVSKLNPSTNSDTIILDVNAWVTGTKELKEVKSFSFFPNPVKNQLTLKFQSKESITVDIYNVLGMRVKSFVHSGITSQTTVNDLQNGVYFIRFVENGKLYTKQFTKAE